LKSFEQENAANNQLIETDFRLDAGFGSSENDALMIEMVYKVNTKPRSHHVVYYLRKQVNEHTTQVGTNAQMVTGHIL
jgi:hypothetical protein